MIEGFRTYNFKAFVDTGRIPLRPITCLVGRNSSGKSSLAQALLLLKQSIQQQAVGSSVPTLLLNGPQVELGTFADLVHRHQVDQNFGMSFDCNVEDLDDQDEEGDSLISLDLPRNQPHPYFGRFRLKRRRPGRTRERHRGSIELEFSPQESFGPALSTLNLLLESERRLTLRRTVGTRREQHWRTYVKGLPAKSVSSMILAARLFPEFWPRYGTRTGRAGPVVRRTCIEANTLIAYLEDFLERSRFVGPFRTPPSRRYMFSGFGASDVGATGQQAIDLLIAESLISKSKRPLLRAVSFWLNKLGLARSLDLKPLARKANLFELTLKDAGHPGWANYADVGFGVSQALPILVQGLLMPRRGLYIVQQPELHLHPDAQADLVDYFIYLASFGIRCLIETHSEYFLIRLRRRLAERYREIRTGAEYESRITRQTITRDDVAVLLSKESKNDGFSIEEIRIGDDFQFSNLPKDFMDQAIRDRVGLLKALRGS